MNRLSTIRNLFLLLRKFIIHVEKKLERDIVNFLLLILLLTAFVLKIEVVFWELTIQVPLIILAGLLYGGYYYFVVSAPVTLPRKLKYKEIQTRIALSVLSMSTIVTEVLIHDFKTPISYVKLWMAIWIVVGAEALVELLAYLKTSSKNKRKRKTQLINRQPVKRRTDIKIKTTKRRPKPNNPE